MTEDALAIDRECGDEDAVAGDLVNLAQHSQEHGRLPGGAVTNRRSARDAVGRRESEEARRSRCTTSPTSIARWATWTRRWPACGCADAELAQHLLPVQRSFHLTSIAHIELQQGRIDAAIATYQQAIELSRRARHAEGLAQSLRTLGEVLFELGQARRGAALPRRGGGAVCAARRRGGRSRHVESCGHGARARPALHVESRDAWKRVQPLRRQVGRFARTAERDGGRRADHASDRRRGGFERDGVRSRAGHGVDARRMASSARLPQHARDSRVDARSVRGRAETLRGRAAARARARRSRRGRA